MTNHSEIPWKRITAEGVVIVVSILLAFSIDAWWEERLARSAEIEQLVRVSEEIEANSERIQRKLETISVAIEATAEFISWMGPQPVDVTADVYHSQWNKFFSIGTFSVLRSAVQDYLAAGQTGKARHADIRHAVSEWHSYADDLEKQYDLLRIAHAHISDYLEDSVPILHSIRVSGVMDGHPTSKFPYDHLSVLSDPLFESRIALYLLRLEFVSSQALDLQRRQLMLVDRIRSATTE